MFRSAVMLIVLAFALAACSGAPPASPAAYQPELVASPMAALPAAPSTPPPASPGADPNQEAPPPASLDPLTLMLFSHDRWSSVWAEYTLTDYAGDDANTPVQVTRTQVWLRQPGRGRLLTGAAAGRPERLWLGDGQNYQETGGEIAQLPPLEGLVFAPPSPGSDTIYPHPLAGQLSSRLGDYIFSTPFAQRGGAYRLVGSASHAGRDVLVLEYYRDNNELVIDRFWVDAATGVILRAINFTKAGGGAMNSQIEATAVLFDLPLDDSLFTLGAPLPAEFSPGP
jgi:hypothetical protein